MVALFNGLEGSGKLHNLDAPVDPRLTCPYEPMEI